MIDYSNKDPQYEILIPVETRDEIEQLQRALSMELTELKPQLRSDWPQDADEPRIYWVCSHSISWTAAPGEIRHGGRGKCG